MKNLFISEILLLSQKEQKAKRVKFNKRRTLIYGKNQTGKSSLIKSIYWTFGAEPLFNQKFKNANIAALVKFEINGSKFQILRDGKYFALFNDIDELIHKFTSVTNELGPYLGELFSFTPLFQSRSTEFIIPPPAYLFLPYYIDQDNGWTTSWASFKNLQQVKDYKQQCIYYHSGLRPNEYYKTQKEIEKYLKIIEETDKEQQLTNKILLDIKQKLSQTDFNIDIEAFKSEITELLVELDILKKMEDKLKNNLHNLYHIKATIDAQINIVKQAISETNKDLKFATKLLPENVSCPTCGAEYENSFAERFEIAHDEQKSKDLLLELTKDVKEIEEKIAKEGEYLSATSIEVAKINQILEEKKGNLKLRDVIDNAGKNQVKEIFNERNNSLKQILFENVLEKTKLERKLKSFENKERKKEIVEFYRTKLTSFLRKLDVHSLTPENYKSIFTKIESKETGSSRHRAIIAYYFTFFYIMKHYSSSTYCPIIIDSPNQQDQDIEHLDKIMNFINLEQPENTQLILGLAETHGEDFKCPLINLTEKYHLLQDNEYSDVYDEMIEKLEELWF